MSEYDRILNMLKSRLETKHQQYGDSYKGKPYFMFLRLQEEVEELRKELMLGSSFSINEALDVAICGLLIADIMLDYLKEREQ